MAENKDRRSNMAHSTVNAPAKKDGAGGAYTFGSAKDSIEYSTSTGPQGPTGVVVEPAPAPVEPPAKAEEFTLQEGDFPALGRPDAKAAPAWKKEPQEKNLSTTEASSDPEANAKVDPSSVRQGVEFDSSHPRNQFAKKPHHKEGGAAVVQTVSDNIDWTSDGMPKEVQSEIIKGSQNPAHLSMHQQPPPAQVPLKDLKELTKQNPPPAKYPDKAQNNFAPKPAREPVGRGH